LSTDFTQAVAGGGVGGGAGAPGKLNAADRKVKSHCSLGLQFLSNELGSHKQLGFDKQPLQSM
jgi:hypothetical protein